jgi:hypothetical protein
MHYKTLQPSALNNQKGKVLQKLFLLPSFLQGSFALKNYNILELNTFGFFFVGCLSNTCQEHKKP